jgi:hypothetical protein
MYVPKINNLIGKKKMTEYREILVDAISLPKKRKSADMKI